VKISASSARCRVAWRDRVRCVAGRTTCHHVVAPVGVVTTHRLGIGRRLRLGEVAELGIWIDERDPSPGEEIEFVRDHGSQRIIVHRLDISGNADVRQPAGDEIGVLATIAFTAIE
jgi:hypothetical protein